MSSSRRNLMIAVSVGLLAGSLPNLAGAESMTPAEKRNLKFAADFVKAWEDPHYDAEKAVTAAVAADAVIRIADDMPPGNRQALIDELKAIYAAGGHIEETITKSFAHGPVVVQARTATVKIPGKSDQVYEVCALLVIKKGKIVEMTDYDAS